MRTSVPRYRTIATVASRPLALAAVLAGMVLAPAAAAPVPSESQEASARIPTHRPPTATKACIAGSTSRCHLHDYKVTITTHAEIADGTRRSAGDVTMTVRVPLRVKPVKAARSWPESTDFFNSPQAKLIRVSGSGTQQGPDCEQPRWRLASPGYGGGGFHGASGLFRGGKRTHRYQLSIAASYYADSGPSGCACPCIEFVTSQGSYDVKGSIQMSVGSAWSEIQLGFVRKQRAGKLEFPLNRLEEHKGFVLTVKGTKRVTDITSSATARIVFEPVGR